MNENISVAIPFLVHFMHSKSHNHAMSSLSRGVGENLCMVSNHAPMASWQASPGEQKAA